MQAILGIIFFPLLVFHAIICDAVAWSCLQ